MSPVKKIPMRQCVGCGEMKTKKELIRVLKTAENEIIIDKTGKKNGRGAYICSSRDCLDKCIKNHGLERSFKMKITAEIYELLKNSI
ncbi:MAG: YlxR family protein [Lachnospiraceae bacterium]|nr:YlxR family protein [Lachnospiraceae bacterium]